MEAEFKGKVVLITGRQTGFISSSFLKNGSDHQLDY